MKASELMIGDWVQFPYGIRKVTELDSFLDRVCSEDFSVGEVDAIPLTPEILEKNGWICGCFGRRQEWWLNKTKFPIVRYSINDTLHHNELILEFVHQLQHALRLCGIDKEIVL